MKVVAALQIAFGRKGFYATLMKALNEEDMPLAAYEAIYFDLIGTEEKKTR